MEDEQQQSLTGIVPSSSCHDLVDKPAQGHTMAPGAGHQCCRLKNTISVIGRPHYQPVTITFVVQYIQKIPLRCNW
jgi:hypothetical protein